MLEKVKLMAIIREVEPDYTKKAIEILVQEGIRDFEISLSDSELGIECIRQAQSEYAGAEIHLGAGTVSTVEELNILAELKVPYILTPGFDEKIVTYAQKKGIEVLPGVLTPTEVQMAVNCGITRLKLFPADAFGPDYIKALKGPFPQTQYFAVGGVSLETAAAFLENGFAGIAVGSNLVPKKAQESDMEMIREKARKYVEIVRTFQ